MERKRVPGYITRQTSSAFGLDVKVEREVAPKSEFYPSGDPVPEGRQGGSGDYRNMDVNTRRDPITPGVIGSQEKEDLPNALPTYLDTIACYPGEQADQSMHGSVNTLRMDKSTPIPFNTYETFQPRRAPMPRAAQDDGFLEAPANLSADPLMTDEDSTSLFTKRAARRKDLFGENRDGMLHNSPGHPGFAAVEAKIGQEPGIRNPGAVLAAATRRASPAAKKANPNLNKVK